MKRPVFFIMLLTVLLGIYIPCSAEQNILTVKTNEEPVIDGLDSDPAWQNAPVFITLDKNSKLEIRIQSVYTDTKIFFLVSFADPDESRTHKSWIWNAGREIYTVGTDREDTFVFKWNMESKAVDLSIYSNQTYRADIWFWKACRTDGAGYADDKSHLLSTTEDRNATEHASKSGKTMYLLRTGDEGESSYEINLLGEYQGDIVPRYTLKKPSGSRSDIHAKGTWKDGRWNIEFSRKLITGNADDIQFVPGQTYLFGVSRYEIAGRIPNRKLSNPFYGNGDINETLWLKFIQ